MPAGWVALAAAAIGATGSIVAGNEQANAQKNAAQTQQNMFNTIVGQEQPFLNAGYGAESTLQGLLGLPSTPGGAAPTGTVAGTNLPAGYLTQTFNPTQQQLENYPGYQFQLGQGQLATESANTPGTGALSGASLKSLMNFNQGLAASNYGNYFNQFQTQQTNIFNRLSTIAALGQNAAGNLGNQGAQLGTGIAQAQAAAGGSIAGGIVGATNSLGSSFPMYLALQQYMNNGQNTAAMDPYASTAGTGSATGQELPDY